MNGKNHLGLTCSHQQVLLVSHVPVFYNSCCSPDQPSQINRTDKGNTAVGINREQQHARNGPLMVTFSDGSCEQESQIEDFCSHLQVHSTQSFHGLGVVSFTQA